MTYDRNPAPGTMVRKLVGTDYKGEIGTVLGTHISEWSGMTLVAVAWLNGTVTVRELPESLEVITHDEADAATLRFRHIHRSDPVAPLVKDSGHHFDPRIGFRANTPQ